MADTSWRFRLRREQYLWLAMLCAISCCCMVTAGATDFVQSFKAYQAGRFDEARAGFLELAALGDGASQFNLGVMALRGEGVAVDRGAALGWMSAAEQNGYAVQNGLLDKLAAQVSVDERKSADALLKLYGLEALLADVLPDSADAECPGWSGSTVSFGVPPEYPYLARRYLQDGIVVVQVTVGLDGLARDPHIVSSEPDIFDDAAVDAVLRSRFEPARYHDQPVELRGDLKHTFSITGGQGYLWNRPAFLRVKQAADAGYASAQYTAGVAALLDPTLGLGQEAAFQMVLSAAKGGDPRAQYWIANRLEAMRPCHGKDKALPWLRQAASGGDAAAKLALVERLVDDNADPATLDQARGLLQGLGEAKDVYVVKHAIAWVTVLHPALRDPALARQLAKALAKLTKSIDPQLNEVHAAAAAANGQFENAVKEQRRAVDQARELHWNTALMEERLASYVAGRAWHGDLFKVMPNLAVPPAEGKQGHVCKEGDLTCQRLPGADGQTKKPELGSRLPSS